MFIFEFFEIGKLNRFNAHSNPLKILPNNGLMLLLETLPR